MVHLYEAVSRQHELHREILSFSVSHDNEVVGIYGHYPLIDEFETRFYRHTIRKFDFVEQDGKEKWTAYKCIRNLYDIFVPIHIRRIQVAIEQLPDPEDPAGEILSRLNDAESEQDDSRWSASQSQDSVLKLPSSQTTEHVFEKPRRRTDNTETSSTIVKGSQGL
ncbi:MAG: hypothetical protein M1817_005195 [Caeruleum heppii]|nr:MAG: hypothetical protein M1817_005195 [Caeruleum heppii]